MGKLLLRRGLHYSGKNWTGAHRQWIGTLEWTHSAERAVVEDYLLAIDQAQARRDELDARLAEIGGSEPYRERVGWLRCFRGIDTLTAMLILAELHDFRRFGSAPTPVEERTAVGGSREREMRWCGAYWWKRPGIIDTGPAQDRRWPGDERGSPDT
jgi:hypothetical protein